MKKNVLLILLFAVMMLCMIPAAVFADDTELKDYKFYYYNEDTSQFGTAGTWRNYLRNDFKGRYVQDEGESVFVNQLSNQYEISITCKDEITYEDLLGNDGVLSNIYKRNDIKEPLVYFGAGTKESIYEYNNATEFNKERNSTDQIPLTGAKFYMLEGSTINTIEISVDKPVCGTEIKEVGEGPTGFPDTTASVKIPEGSHFHVYTIQDLPISIWAEGNASGLDALKPFIGTIKGDEEYKLVVNLEPDFGYVFGEGIGTSNILINNKEVLLIDREDDDVNLVIVGAETAVHVWGAGKVTKKPTLKATGVMTYKCKHCSATKTKTIAKLKANTLKVSGKTATVKFSKLKKKSQTLKASKVLKFANKGKGKLSYRKYKGSKKITINKKTGKVTVKKGLKKGRYTVRVKVKAAGTSTIAPLTKKVKITIKVK